MSGTSDFEQNKYVDATLRGQTYTPLANVFVALLKCTKGLLARSTAYALNDTIAVQINGFNKLYKVTAAGTTAGSAPQFTGNSNEVIVDGTTQLTEQSLALEGNSSMNEISGGAYARASVACTLAAWAGTQGATTTVASNGSSGQTSNNAAITFAQATADWTTGTERIWGFALYDAVSAGNLVRFGGFQSVHAVVNTNTFNIAISQLVVKVDN
jgi:hypothetical protein